MASSLLLSFAPGSTLGKGAGDHWQLQTRRGSIPLDTLTPGVRAAIESLASRSATEDELADSVARIDGATALPGFYFALGRLRRLGLISYSIKIDGAVILVLEPASSDFPTDFPLVAPGQSWSLSRFAYARGGTSALVLESPLAQGHARLRGPGGGAVLAALAHGASSGEICHVLNCGDEESVRQGLGLLRAVRLICEAHDDGSTAEDEDAALAHWEFHDLLFHARSRLGWHDLPAGATYRFLDRTPPSAAIKPPMADDPLPLYRPDLVILLANDAPLTQVLEQRTSIREHGDRPITAHQLGEFLYRTARVRAVEAAEGESGRPYEASSRPYPGGGAAYELEIYLTVDSCDGLEPGLYHYEPEQHGLSMLSGPSAETTAMLRGAESSSGMTCSPQVLIGLTARFRRLSWKYETIAYAVVLKDVGVLFQTMYLVATAMGLAPCALGSGDGYSLAAAAGLNYLQESSVGEFMLGSKRF